MSEAVASFAARAGEKLRRHGLAAGHLTVFMHTSHFGTDPRYSSAASVRLDVATADSRELIGAAKRAARHVWRDGYRYSKAGVILEDLGPEGRGQASFLFEDRGPKAIKLMATMDAINAKMGRGTVFPAAAGVRQTWRLRADHHSLRYTTRWEDLPRVHAGPN